MHMGYVHGRSPVGDLLSLTTIRNVLGDAAAGGGGVGVDWKTRLGWYCTFRVVKICNRKEMSMSDMLAKSQTIDIMTLHIIIASSSRHPTR